MVFELSVWFADCFFVTKTEDCLVAGLISINSWLGRVQNGGGCVLRSRSNAALPSLSSSVVRARPMTARVSLRVTPTERGHFEVPFSTVGAEISVFLLGLLQEFQIPVAVWQSDQLYY